MRGGGYLGVAPKRKPGCTGAWRVRRRVRRRARLTVCCSIATSLTPKERRAHRSWGSSGSKACSSLDASSHRPQSKCVRAWRYRAPRTPGRACASHSTHSGAGSPFRTDARCTASHQPNGRCTSGCKRAGATWLSNVESRAAGTEASGAVAGAGAASGRWRGRVAATRKAAARLALSCCLVLS